MDRPRLSEILSLASGKRILVIGDLMLDHYLWGRVDRISPEAPVPVVEVESETYRPGGAANVIRNLRELDAEIAAVGVIGDDAEGEKLRALLAAEGADLSGVVNDATRPTTSKTRIIARRILERGGERVRGQHLVRADREMRSDVSGPVAQRLIERIGDVRDADAIFVSDYVKGVVTIELMNAVRTLSARLNRPAVVDPKGRNFDRYHGVAAISPNQSEALGALNLDGEDEAVVVATGHELVKQLDLQAVFMTRSEKGVSLFETGGRVAHFRATARRISDVSGAGDTTAAVYTLALAGGASETEAAFVGNLAGGIVVGKAGVAAVSAQELLQAAGGLQA